MTTKQKGSAAAVALIAIALCIVAGAIIYYSKNKNIDTPIVPDNATTTQSPENTASTNAGNKNIPDGETTFESSTIGDLIFNYASSDYDIDGGGNANLMMTNIYLKPKKTTLGTIQIVRKELTPETQGQYTEEALKAGSLAGIPFRKIQNGALSIYERAEKNNTGAMLSYTVVHKNSVYIFWVGPEKSQANIAQLETNRKNFEGILKSIQVK